MRSRPFIKRINCGKASLPIRGSVRYSKGRFLYDENETERQRVKRETEWKNKFRAYCLGKK